MKATAAIRHTATDSQLIVGVAAVLPAFFLSFLRFLVSACLYAVTGDRLIRAKGRIGHTIGNGRG